MIFSMVFWVLAPVLFRIFVEGSVEPWKKSEKSAEKGSEVQLPCILKSPRCGGLHSIKWYLGTQRIFIFSESAGITPGNTDIAARSTMDYNANATTTYLKISNLTLDDEGLYKCEATYHAVNRECNNVQHITLNTTVRPKYLQVTKDEDFTLLTSGATLGPFNEGTSMTLNCESDKGKPVPTVEWYKGDKKLKAIASTEVQENGVGIGRSVLHLLVGRSELGATFTCKVSSSALSEPLTADIRLDVHVPPLKMDVKGVVGHVISGTKILLECKVSAARPPANVTWFNGTDLLTSDSKRFEMFSTKINDNNDGTSETTSYLVFTASEYDNERTFSCFAENSVTIMEGIKPMKVSTIIEVLYAPIISLHPNNITVNETEDFVIFCDYKANPAGLTAVAWFLDKKKLTIPEEHYEGGVTEQTSLTVKNASALDMGTYTCVLSNSVGDSTSEDFVDVSVLFKPTVEVIVDPEVPVNEADRTNVSLTCNVIDGNPTSLNAVRWYLDGDLLKELPDCVRNLTQINTDEISTFCDIDPSKLLLEAVGRSFHGNYSCEGRNDAGWGPISSNTPVTVYYKPGPATISYQPKRVIKRGSLNITCSVIDPGRPPVVGYKWIRGMHRLADQEKSVLTIDSVNLRTKANFTCLGYNDAGEGDPATTFIDVKAPPNFIHALSSYTGYVYNAVNVSIGCRVECSPICNVSWIKNNVPINFTATDRYYVSYVYHPADQSTSDFESIQSNLTWNLDMWPNGELDRLKDNDNYTCLSTSNGFGEGVQSTTHLQVEFPPENLTVTKEVIDVIADSIPESVKCNAIGNPEPSYFWYREGFEKEKNASHSEFLVFKTTVPKRSNGKYICVAHNRHGRKTKSTFVNVLYKPECLINIENINGEDYLVCTAMGNPKEFNFSWSLKSDNDSLGQLAEIREGKSYLLLDTAVTNFRTYICIANNTIGSSLPCERGVAGNIPWWFQLEGDLLIIVIIVAVVILLVVIICGIIIYLICRRKQLQAKYSNHVVSLEEREHPEGGPPSPTESIRSLGHCPSLNSPAVPRWPLKPGVLVHINRTHSLSSGLSSVHASSNLQMHSTSNQLSSTSYDRYHSRGNDSIVRRPVRPFRRRKTTISQIGIPIPVVHDEGMIARANKIRAMFSAQLKQPDSFPGISRDKTAVTYKRIVPRCRRDAPSLGESNCNAVVSGECGDIRINANPVSRKRKKPGADPSHPAKNNSHIDSVSETLPDHETKTFYENLPFHGIQTPPNKFVASPKFISSQVSALHGTLHSATSISTSSPSRTLSRAASLCGGSSGYESTRSHLGPHYSPHNMPRSNSPEPKYNTFKPRRRKQHKHAQFYSLRLCKKHDSTRRKNYQLYAIPIIKTCPHSVNNSNTNIITTTSTTNSLEITTPTSSDHIKSSSSSQSMLNSSTHSHILFASSSSSSFNNCNTTSTSTSTTANIHTNMTTSSTITNTTTMTKVITTSNNGDAVTADAGAADVISFRGNCPSIQIPPIPKPRTRKIIDLSQHIYQNIPSPIYPSEPKLTNTCDYKDHYQKIQQQHHQQQKQQEMQQYSIPSSSSNQLTLPLTRSLYHSSIVSPLQTSLAHTNNSTISRRIYSSQHRNKDGSASDGNGNGHINESLSLSLLRSDRLDLDLTYDHQSHINRTGQSRSRTNNDRKKYRKHNNERKNKHRRSSANRQFTENISSSCETSFGRIQELGIPESYKISYPHYYEDNNLDDDCSKTLKQQQTLLNHQKNDEKKILYSDNNFLDKSKNNLEQVNQYPQLHFRDVGQEIDV